MGNSDYHSGEHLYIISGPKASVERWSTEGITEITWEQDWFIDVFRTLANLLFTSSAALMHMPRSASLSLTLEPLLLLTQ